MATSKKNSYTSDNIKNHQYPESVHNSPSMFIGSTDAHGIFQLLKEVIDNIVDEALEGRASTAWIDVSTSGCYRVADDGNGIPVGITEINEPVTGTIIKVPTVQAVLSIPHTSGKFSDEAYKVSRGVHGLGVKLTNALSNKTTVTTFNKGSWWTISFKLGKLSKELTKCKAPLNPVTGKLMTRGTLFEFHPEQKFFSASKFPPSLLLSWAEVAAYFTPKFKIVLKGTKKTLEICKPGGIGSYVEDRTASLKATYEQKLFSHSSPLCDVVVGFSTYDGCDIRGFTNGLENVDKGKHVDSVTGAIYAGLKPYIKTKKIEGKPVPVFREADLREGLVGLVNAKLHKAQFSSQDKAKLTDDRVGKEFEAELTKVTTKFFTENKALAIRLCERATKMNELKTKFTMSKKAAASLNAVKRNGLPAKYAAFDSRTKVPDRELFLVEGESAGGTTKEARFPYQAVLPLKGKVMNALKDSKGKTLESEEIINILAAIGYDVKAADPYAKLTVGKIICLADPDPDGPFVGDTKIRIRRLDDGDLGMDPHEVTIESLSRNPSRFEVLVWSGNKEIWAPATAELVRNVDTLIALEIAGTKYKVSEDHKFLCHASPPAMRGREVIESPFRDLVYVAAKNMRIGDRVYLPAFDGSRKPAEADKFTRLGFAPVSKMRIQKLSEPVPVYCLTVPKHHNFILPSGIVSSNCHINSLLLTLFYRYLPELFIRGMIYVANAPEFYSIHKGQLITGATLSEVQKKLVKVKAPPSTPVSHIKGWGEIDANIMRILAMAPETRNLIKIKAIEAEDRVDFVKLMDDNVEYRRKMLGLPSSVKDTDTEVSEDKTVKKVADKTAANKASAKRAA
jgi:DNA gyrase subunit B